MQASINFLPSFSAPHSKYSAKHFDWQYAYLLHFRTFGLLLPQPNGHGNFDL